MKDRITTIIQTEGLTPSSFADAIGVSRASINHILNGRNNPSLEVASKILVKYDNINSDWLIFGKEPMYKNVKGIYQPDLFTQVPVEMPKESSEPKYSKEIELNKPEIEPKDLPISTLNLQNVVSKKIAKIIILYTDKTYDTLSVEG
jgi:Predicted transcriptional regulators